MRLLTGTGSLMCALVSRQGDQLADVRARQPARGPARRLVSRQVAQLADVRARQRHSKAALAGSRWSEAIPRRASVVALLDTRSKQAAGYSPLKIVRVADEMQGHRQFGN